jgi:PAS domain S-box-containing protein
MQALRRIDAVSVKTFPDDAASNAKSFESLAAAQLTSTLYGAASRAAFVWLAGLGLAVFGPLAMSTRNGWLLVALVGLLVACTFRWVIGWYLQQERMQARPEFILAAHALVGLAWTSATIASLWVPLGHSSSIVLLASALMCATAPWLLQGHRDACMALLAPLALVPTVVIFLPGPWSLPLALACGLGLAAAAGSIDRRQTVRLQATASEMHARSLQAASVRHRQTATAALQQLDARERDFDLLFQHADVGIARVDGFAVRSANPMLARLLGRAPESIVGHDILGLLHHEHRDAVLAVLKGSEGEDDGAPALHRGLVELRATDGTRHSVELVVRRAARGGTCTWLFNPVDEHSPSRGPVTATVDPAPDEPLNRESLIEQLHRHAEHRRRAAVLAVQIEGLEALGQRHGRANIQALLTATVRRLQAVCRDGDRVAALGEGVFAVLVAGDISDLTLALLSERVRGAVATVHRIDGQDFTCTTRIAAALCQLDTQRVGTAIAQLDEALREVGAGQAARATAPDSAAATAALAAGDFTDTQPRRDAAIAPRETRSTKPRSEASPSIDLISLDASAFDSEDEAISDPKRGFSTHA